MMGSMLDIPNPITYALWYYSASVFLFLCGAATIFVLVTARSKE